MAMTQEVAHQAHPCTPSLLQGKPPQHPPRRNSHLRRMGQLLQWSVSGQPTAHWTGKARIAQSCVRMPRDRGASWRASVEVRSCGAAPRASLAQHRAGKCATVGGSCGPQSQRVASKRAGQRPRRHSSPQAIRKALRCRRHPAALASAAASPLPGHPLVPDCKHLQHLCCRLRLRKWRRSAQ